MAALLPAKADQPAFDAAALEFVEREVRPLLVERCFKCHGNIEKPKGGLRLVDRAAVLQGGDSGPAAVPGKSAESYLIQTIGYRDALQMPPDGKLSDAQIATLTKWVELGLPWPAANSTAAAMPADKPGDAHAYQITEEQRQFWAFQPVKVVPAARDRRNRLAAARKSTATSLPSSSRPTCGMPRRPIDGR